MNWPENSTFQYIQQSTALVDINKQVLLALSCQYMPISLSIGHVGMHILARLWHMCTPWPVQRRFD